MVAMVSNGTSAHTDYDVLIIGAGLSGCYALYKMRELGFKAKVIETAPEVGGTWFWNRYPGARFDSESYSYQFSWSKELLDEWTWTEHFAPQAETERYINFLCDKFELRPDIQFNSRIKKAEFRAASRTWQLTIQDGRTYTSRFLITGLGILSDPTYPNIPGVRDFQGEAYHTARWPHESVSFEGKRIGIIGTGATAIQAIPVIAKRAASLTVFQRTPNWAVPLHNSKISPEEMDKIRQGYPALFKHCENTVMNFMHDKSKLSTWDVDQEERERFWEKLYAEPGFGFWMSNFNDIGVDQKACDLVSDFVAKKIRQRVHNQETAEKLIPKNHGFGTRRVPMETHYFETYNRPNVRLVDVNEQPIQQITKRGVKTTKEEMEFDMMIYATGFDPITGAFDAIEWRGVDDKTLKEKWAEGPRTYLGLSVSDFPNMLMILGPHQLFGNVPRSVEFAVDWIGECLRYCRDHDISWIEATPEGVARWNAHVHKCAKGKLSNQVDSWQTGINKNVPGKQKRIIARYSGTAPEFRRECREVAEAQYNTFTLA